MPAHFGPNGYTKLMLRDEIKKIAATAPCYSSDVRQKFLLRLSAGELTRDENKETHFCAYFLPYNEAEKKIFLVHHKKANLWLSPGGHIDKGENFLTTLNREIREELGVVDFYNKLPEPFFISITPIENPTLLCKVHYDTWFLMPADGSGFDVDPKEFYDTRWVTLEESASLLKDAANLLAVEALKQNKL